MSVNLTIAGTTYAFPTVGENNWGQVVTNWATAVSTYLLQRTGGSFSLTNEVDFGANFATKQAYIKSRTANPASAGFGRLARADVVSWRNQANNANIDLAVNSSNELTWNGSRILLAGGGLIVNADIAANAAIDFSKLAALASGNLLVGSAGNVPVSVAMSGDVTISNAGVTAIGSNKVTNAMLAQVATAIFKGRTTSGTGNVEDLSVIQATALLNAMVGDTGSGGTKGLVPAPAMGDATKCLSGAGTWIAIISDTIMTTRGDMIFRNSSNVTARFPVGAAGKVVRSDGTDPSYQFPNGVIQTTTTTDTVSQNSDVVLASTAGGSYTDTLPNPATVGNGKRLSVRKTTTDLNVLTLSDGSFTTTVNTQGEVVELFTTGGAWAVLSRCIPSVSTAVTLTLNGFGTTSLQSTWVRRLGDRARFTGYFKAGTTAASTASLQLPSGYVINTAKITNAASVQQVGWFTQVRTGAQNESIVWPLFFDGSDTDDLFPAYESGSDIFTKVNGNSLIVTNDGASFDFEIPIAGWNG